MWLCRLGQDRTGGIWDENEVDGLANSIRPQVRRRFKGQLPMPKIGYGSNKRTRHMLPTGHREMLVHNLSDLELLLMHSGKYAAVIAHGVSSKKRIEMLERAKVLGVKWVPSIITARARELTTLHRVTNPAAKLRTEEA